MKNVLIFDWETTISNKGNPFDRNNKAVVLGLKWRGVKESIILYSEDFHRIQWYIDRASVLVGFNAKFDLHWLRKVGVDISKVNIWDCQLGEFILNNQKTPYPSLNDALAKYGFPLKLDVVKTEYWDKGIDTDKVPRNILTEYLTGDLEGTENVFEEQFKQFENDSRKTLFKLHNLDLLVLEEMEWNGIKFNTEEAKAKADEIEKELIDINQELMGIVGDVPINFNSNVHLSALLYGGSFSVDMRIPIGVYKSGTKIGQVRHKILEKVYDFPRLVEPIKGTETAASQKKSLETGAEPSQWEVNDTVLRKLKLSKEAKNIVALLKRNSELEKLRGTYLIGYSNLIEKMNWPTDTLHGTLNQCRVVTGRLSSATPNLQNVDPQTKVFMESRYGKIINADAKALEVVCAAYLSKDKIMMQEIWDKVDIHSANQKLFNIPRLIAKILKFRIIYGGTEYSFAEDPDFAEISTSAKYWKKVIDKYFDKYKGLAEWHKNLIQQVVSKGEIRTPTSRVFEFAPVKKYNGELGWPITQIKNFPVQSIGADMMAIARVSFARRFKASGIEGIMVNTVHDSIVCDVADKYVDDVVRIFHEVFRDLPANFEKMFKVKFDLPMTVEVGVGLNFKELVEVKYEN